MAGSIYKAAALATQLTCPAAARMFSADDAYDPQKVKRGHIASLVSCHNKVSRFYVI